MAPGAAALAALLSVSATVFFSAACLPSESHVDCNFYGLSSPKWSELTNLTGQLTAAWKASLASTPEYPADQFSGQGLVITATKLDIVNVATILETLRSGDFNLPVEIWYTGEFNTDIIDALSATNMNVAFKNVANYASPADLKSTVTSQGEHVFQAKPLAIISSAFEEVLFMDADNIAISNPAALFSSAQYLSAGALFWPDFWQTATHNPIWSVLGLEPQGWEQESGQIVVNKRGSWAALNLAFFLAKDATFQQMVNGDKEAFRLAFLATRTPFFMVETPVATAGSETETGFCGHTMVQHDLAGAPLFLHHNSLKHGASISWQVMKSVAAGKSFTVVPLPPATINEEPVSCLDLTGTDVIVTPAPVVAFEGSFSQRQSAAHPSLKAVSQNEFKSAVHATMRKLLQGNGTFTVSTIPNSQSCPIGTNPCASSAGGFFTCCSTTCSGQYYGLLATSPVNDRRALCSTPNGDVDIPSGASPVTTPPAPVVVAAGVPPVNGLCGNPDFNQPCYPAGAGTPSICCPSADYQCASTTGSTPVCHKVKRMVVRTGSVFL